jgi:cephalosporin-C deacetylase-like acetyl esterase
MKMSEKPKDFDEVWDKLRIPKRITFDLEEFKTFITSLKTFGITFTLDMKENKLRCQFGENVEFEIYDGG